MLQILSMQMDVFTEDFEESNQLCRPTKNIETLVGV